MSSRRISAACLLTCLASPAFADHPSSSFGTEGSGPIKTVSAVTMPQGKLGISLASEYIRSAPFSNNELAAFAGSHIHAHSTDWTLTTTLGAGYGLAENLDINLRIPYIRRENIRAGTHVHGGGMATNSTQSFGDSAGPGDIAALGKYRFWQYQKTSAALLFGIKLPTGKTDLTYQGQKLETEHQPGSGSWDGMAGFAVSRRIRPVAFDASALYTLTTEGSQDTDLGDRLNYNLAVSYRIGGDSHDHGDSAHSHESWDLVLELNGEWSDKKEINDRDDRNSGGNQIFLSPGLRYEPDEKWSVHAALGIPVVENIGKGHAQTDYKFTLGFSRSF